jgi:hypothetical protein
MVAEGIAKLPAAGTKQVVVLACQSLAERANLCSNQLAQVISLPRESASPVSNGRAFFFSGAS